jgi:hypothetical protein
MKKNNNIIREEDCPFVYEVTNTKNNSLELEKLKKETNLRYTLIITK